MNRRTFGQKLQRPKNISDFYILPHSLPQSKAFFASIVRNYLQIATWHCLQVDVAW